ncbi:MAG: DNA polymerase I, partial [Oscillospiraceae bacterium]|nr:DNA polymerase I [Oscillospiraceae bacterium]
GDPSDNIPGVSGVGEKTALDLVRRFGGIDNIYGSLDTLDVKERVRTKLEEGRDSALMSFELATIRRDAPLEFVPEQNVVREPDGDALYNIFQKLEFFSLLQKLGLAPSPEAMRARAETGTGEFSAVDVVTVADVAIMLARMRSAPLVSVHVAPGLGSVAVTDGSDDVFVLSETVTADYDKALREIFGSSIKKAGHYIKDIMRQLHGRGIESDGWAFDTALAAYLLAPTENSYEYGRLTARYCGYTASEPESVYAAGAEQLTMFDGGSGADGPEKEPQPGAQAWAAAAIRDLCGVLPDALEQNGLDGAYHGIDLPLCAVLADMERAGFMVDRDALRGYGDALSAEISGIERSIYDIAGERFNINSPKQLGGVLFEKLKLPAPKKKKTGYSTAAEVLAGLADKHPVIELITDYRLLSKLKATYTDALIKEADGGGRVHTSFQMTVTATGRLSSVKPNLQSIPVRSERGGQLRRMFIAGGGRLLAGADYSQIELRLLAHMAGDERMIEAFRRGGDIHAETASQIFGVSREDVTPLLRRQAKAVNFGIVYGMSAFSLAGDIKVSVKEAQSYIDGYLENFSGVRAYMSEIVERAKRDGYVTTLFGRRRGLPELKSSDRNVRMFGERVALNTPVQGTAADIIKLAMINTARRIKAEGLGARLILQVHDELIAECPEDEAETVKLLLREEMENVTSLTVPLVAETRAGKSWYDLK